MLCFVYREAEEKVLIEHYFWLGFRYTSMIRMLLEYHGILLSVRTLHRRLLDYGLSRRRQPSAMDRIWNAIITELRGPGI